MIVHWIDWMILVVTLACIILYGVWKTKRSSQDASEFLKGTQRVKWWTIGISVMATQASAITFMSTPGQAFHDGMGFVQMYLGLPLAMIVISITFIPAFHKLNVYTAYEYLETRFDHKTRILTALIFMIQRGLGTALTIYAPSIILSTIFGWDLSLLNMAIGVMVILYIISGGTKAVSVTQNYQMAVIMGGMFVAFYMILKLIPDEVSIHQALQLANISDKMKAIDFSIDLNNRYTFWSGITGGFFLAMAYFGTDQSQVQRYLTGNNMYESRLGLMFNALLKVPMQFFILLCGVLVYVFYLFFPAPIFFNQVAYNKALESGHQKELVKLQEQYDTLFIQRKNHIRTWINNDAANDDARSSIVNLNKEESRIRNAVKEVMVAADPAIERNDKDYVFIHFVLSQFPRGMIGLLLAIIFCAAMSATASGISALATCTTVDIYKRNFKKDGSEKHYVTMSRWFILLWGIIVIVFANLSSLFENLIQFVNIVGSIFYGPVLGIFITGFYFPSLLGRHVFPAGLLAQILVIVLYMNYEIGFLWLNPIGCLLVISFAFIIKFSAKI